MAERTVKSPAGERRVALGERQRVAEMSQEEMRMALLTSDVTGLPNRRAFEEAGRAVAVALCDVDGLKALNDFAYDAGNALLRAMAASLREAGLAERCQVERSSAGIPHEWWRLVSQRSADAFCASVLDTNSIKRWCCAEVLGLSFRNGE